MTSSVSPAIEIRDAGPADIEAITQIYDDAVRNGTATYELDPPGREEMARRLLAVHGEGYPWIVAVRDGKLTGYAYVNAFRARPAYRFIVENSIYVAPDAQGMGIGRQLLAELIERTRALGFRQIVAVIGDGGPQSASVKLHERAGFVHCGTMPGSGFKHGRWLDTVFMQLALNGGDTLPPDPASLPERRFRGTG